MPLPCGGSPMPARVSSSTPTVRKRSSAVPELSITPSAAYYVVAEALTNVLKYSEATSATVRVLTRDDRLTVEISDDGRGGALPANGSGLGGLKDRVEALDGIFEVDSPPGRGTCVRAELPLAIGP